MARNPLRVKGYLYGVVHPSFPGYVKIGKAMDPAKRLISYQTGDPHRRYQMVWTLKTSDYDLAERIAHSRLKALRVRNTEWFRTHPDDAYHLIHSDFLENPE